MDTRTKALKVFEENGIDLEQKNPLAEIDSLIYISTIVSLEEAFDIEFPDAFLMHNAFEDMERLFSMIDDLCLDSSDEEDQENLLSLLLQELLEKLRIANQGHPPTQRMEFHLVDLLEGREINPYSQDVYTLKENLLKEAYRLGAYRQHSSDEMVHVAAVMDILERYQLDVMDAEEIED